MAEGTVNEGRISHRGFASMNAERQRQIASMGKADRASPTRNAAFPNPRSWQPKLAARVDRRVTEAALALAEAAPPHGRMWDE
jgi:hypothetical protein